MAATSLRPVHASDREVLDEKIAGAVDSALGAGASADVSTASPYQKLFGEGYVGRPLRTEHPTGRPTGDRKITELARRRATRVLRHIYAAEFERLMALEAQWIEEHGDGE